MSAPEHFQRRILEILSGVTGTVSMINDVLVFVKKNKKQEEKWKPRGDFQKDMKSSADFEQREMSVFQC